MNVIKRIKQYYSYNAPKFGTAEDWTAHRRAMRDNAPIRDFLHNTARSIRVIKSRISDAIWWVRHRTINRMHVISTGLPPGYSSCASIILHSNFQILVDFVEIEKAAMQWTWGDEYEKASRWERLKHRFNKRDADRGLRYLAWECSLDGPQAETAKTIVGLYRWWTQLRPKRREVKTPEEFMEIFRTEDVLYTMTDEFKEKHPELYLQNKIAFRMNWKLNKVHHAIDSYMLKKLIDIREGMWT